MRTRTHPCLLSPRGAHPCGGGSVSAGKPYSLRPGSDKGGPPTQGAWQGFHTPPTAARLRPGQRQRRAPGRGRRRVAGPGTETGGPAPREAAVLAAPRQVVPATSGTPARAAFVLTPLHRDPPESGARRRLCQDIGGPRPHAAGALRSQPSASPRTQARAGAPPCVGKKSNWRTKVDHRGGGRDL